MDAWNVGGGEGGVGFGDGVGEVDRASGVFEDDGFEAEVFAVDGGVADAEVVRYSAEEEAGEATFAEITGEAGGGKVIVFEEGGVAIDLFAEAFAEDEFGVRDLEGGVEVCAGGVLEAVIGPEGLGAVGSLDLLIGLGAGVGGGEGDVLGGVPVLREDGVGEAGGEGVDEGDDGVAFLDGQGSAGAEVVLEVDDEEGVRGLELHGGLMLADGKELRSCFTGWGKRYRCCCNLLG